MENFKQALKRTIAGLMVMVLVISIAPIGSLADVDWSEFVLTASAEEELAATGQCGENVYWNYNSAAGELVISGTGPMYDYDYDFMYEISPFCQKKITAVVINNGVTNIGNWVFYDCWDLTSIVIPDSVMSIGEGAVCNCDSLTNVKIGNGVTSIGYKAFENCDGLRNIEIPDSVTSIEQNAFYQTKYYNDESNWMDNVLYIGNHLIEAKDIISDTYSLRENTKTIANNAFYDCYSLTGIEISDSVTSIGDRAFSNCESLTSVNFGNSVTSIGESAFYDCESLTSIEIPDSVISVGGWAFEWCVSLISIEIPDSVTGIGKDAFYQTAYYTDESNWTDNVLYIGNHLIKAKDTINGDYSVRERTKTIADSAFSGCESLTSVKISNSVTDIGDNAFFDCYGITSIEIPDSVTSIGNWAFIGCNSLTKITVDENNLYYSSDYYGVLFDEAKTIIVQYPVGNSRTSYVIPDSVKSIGDSAFAYCNSLTSIKIPDSVTSIGERAFYSCGSLGSIKIPSSVTNLGDFVFSWCDNLRNVEIVDGVASVSKYAFAWCHSLTSIEIPDSVTSIGYWAFYACENLTSIELPDSITSIGEYTFSACRRLKSIEIPEGVTSIGGDAFSGCAKLESVIIPDSVTNIGYWAFHNCKKLASIEIRNPECEIYDGSRTIHSGATIYGFEGSTAQAYAEKYGRAFELCCSHENTIEHEGVSATCTISGYTEGIYCEDCGKWARGHKTIKARHTDENSDMVCEVCGEYARNIVKSGNCGPYDYDAIDYGSNVKYALYDDGLLVVSGEGEMGDFQWLSEFPDNPYSDYVLDYDYETEIVENNIKSVIIEDGVTSIGSNAFLSFEKLESIEISDSVTSIGMNAFSWCRSITDVYYGGSEEDWSYIVFDYYNDELTNANIHFNSTMPEPHTHSYIAAIITPATCTKVGVKTYTCSCGDSYTETIPATGHTETTIAAVPATCTTTGLTEGKKCSVCDEIIVAQEIVAKLDHTSDNGTVTKSATCATTGIKAYKCTVCKTTVKTETIPATGHTETTLDAVPATCTSTGLTAGKKCTVCGTITAKQQTIKATGHKETTLAGKSATYTSTGLTAGKKCSVCGRITVAQKTIPKLTLGKVSGLKAKSVKVAKSSEITLAWNSVGNGVKYEVYQKNGKKWKKLKATSSTSYTVKKLKSDKEYQFKVRAVVDGAEGAYSSTLKVETIPETATLKLKAGSKQLTASWKSVSDISGYEVQYSTSKKFTKKTTKTVNVKKSLKKTTIKKLTKGKKYYVRVRTYKTVNGKKIYSNWSTVKNVKVK